MKRNTIRISGLLSALALLAFGDTNAAVRVVAGNAVSYCQTALPVFDGNVRKRPLGVQNEGPGDAFVTCAFTAQRTELSYVEVFFSNTGTSPVSVTCTGVTGVNRGDNEYVSKTVIVPASGDVGDAVLLWTGSDFAEPGPVLPGGGMFGVSCKLPQGASIDDSNVSFNEDFGD
jgi:hypothetical protein